LLSIIQKNTVSEEDLIEVFNLINNTNAKDQTKEYACKLVEKSKNYLSKLSETKAKQNLIALANFIVERTY
jgi:geranylgeranyl pyrophosphate synthase